MYMCLRELVHIRLYLTHSYSYTMRYLKFNKAGALQVIKDTVFAREYGPVTEHLCQYTAYAPYIYRLGVTLRV